MTVHHKKHVGKSNIVNVGVLSVSGLHNKMVYTESVRRQLVQPIPVCYKLIQKSCFLFTGCIAAHYHAKQHG